MIYDICVSVWMKNVIKDIDIEVHYFCSWHLQTNTTPWLDTQLEFTSYSIEVSNIPSSSRESLHEYIASFLTLNYSPTYDNYSPSLAYDVLRIPLYFGFSLTYLLL